MDHCSLAVATVAPRFITDSGFPPLIIVPEDFQSSPEALAGPLTLICPRSHESSAAAARDSSSFPSVGLCHGCWLPISRRNSFRRLRWWWSAIENVSPLHHVLAAGSYSPVLAAMFQHNFKKRRPARNYGYWAFSRIHVNAKLLFFICKIGLVSIPHNSPDVLKGRLTPKYSWQVFFKKCRFQISYSYKRNYAQTNIAWSD